MTGALLLVDILSNPGHENHEVRHKGIVAFSAFYVFESIMAIFTGTNGEAYLKTFVLVTCIQNFQQSKGPIVGIMKGFAGLGSVNLNPLYAVVRIPEPATIIFMVSVGPSLVTVGLMVIISYVKGHCQVHLSNKSNSLFIYTSCLLLASYFIGIVLVQDFTLLIFSISILVILPLSSKAQYPTEGALFSEPLKGDASILQEGKDHPEVILSEEGEEKPKDIDSSPPAERKKGNVELQIQLLQAVSRGEIGIMQAMVKDKLWPMFSKITVIMQSEEKVLVGKDFSTFIAMHVAVQCKITFLLTELAEDLKQPARCTLTILWTIEESDEHVIARAGDDVVILKIAFSSAPACPQADFYGGKYVSILQASSSNSSSHQPDRGV